MKRYLLTFFAALTALAATAWPLQKEAAFKAGERLSYQVSYKAALVPNTVVADVSLHTNAETLAGIPVYHIWGNGRVMSFFRWFFDLNDTYEVWLDQKTLLPMKLATDIREGKYRKTSQYYYNWDSMKVTTHALTSKMTEERVAEVALTRESLDPVSIFFNMRSHDISTLYEGQDSVLQLVFDTKIETIKFKFIGRETKSLRKVGTFNTLKFACQLTNDGDGDSFQEGTYFYVWVSDDRNKVPLYLESPIRVGSIQAFITKMENLKYPLDSKIR